MQRIKIVGSSTFNPHVRELKPGWEDMVLRMVVQVWESEV
jgi:hypothetical protein